MRKLFILWGLCLSSLVAHSQTIGSTKTEPKKEEELN